MAERDRSAGRAAKRPVGDGTSRNGAVDGLDRLDDAQVMELVSNTYWALLERFLSPDGVGTDTPSLARAG